MGTEQSDLGKYLFDTLVCMNNAYREQLECNCIANLDDMIAQWDCPRHGRREPNYQQMFLEEEQEAFEKKMMAAEYRGDDGER